MSPDRHTPVNEHPRYGQLRPVLPQAAVLLANNPSAMTLEGTNSWLLGQTRRVLVDPGPDDAEHAEALAAAGAIELILLTHAHPDHAAGVARLRARTGSPVRAIDQQWCLAADPLRPGEVIRLPEGDGSVQVLATPGHTSDSASFLLRGARQEALAVLTGDTVLGRGTTMLDHPDGRLADYLTSLRKLQRLDGADEAMVLPAHGRERPGLAGVCAGYLEHRMQRLEQVRQALGRLGAEAGEVGPRQVVEIVYADVDRGLWPAAELSVAAQLRYLHEAEECDIP